MDSMDSNDLGIFRLASLGSYLDALSAITEEMSLRERSTLIELDKRLHEQWGLGQNVLLNWCPEEDGLSLLLIPHYAVAEYASQGTRAGNGRGGQPSEDFLRSLLTGRRRLSREQMDKAARLLGIEKTHLRLRSSVLGSAAQQHVVEQMIKRYSISYVPSRAVVLFDIVEFSLLSPFEQMMQLNSLSYSMNSAQSRLASQHIGIDFSRSTTGDGFYVWNRERSLEANLNLYQFMHLVLADNAIARSKTRQNSVPRLRAGFHVGPCYEFHQAEGLNPTLYHYIVGDVTVELARMIEHALPDQILVGEFEQTMPLGDELVDGTMRLDSIDFVMRATGALGQLTGLELSGDRIDSIKCYLTGARLDSGEFTVRRIVVNDKHGITRHVYNAKVNIHRRNAESILLGIEDRKLGGSLAQAEHSELLRRAVPAV